MSLIDMADKRVVVTGGARGIGKAIVTDFARAGADVVIADLLEQEGTQSAQEVSAATGRKVTAIQTDVTNLESVAQMKEAAVAAMGKVDVLVNNVGWDECVPFMKTIPDFWDKVIAINYKGVLNTCYTLLPSMTERKSGAIVNIASDAGRAGSMGESVYSGCKAGVIALSKSLAREHARENIRVNVVSPGITQTPLLEAVAASNFGGKMLEAIVKSIPLGRRPAKPHEVSPAVVFLASDAASYITGQVLSVSGGLTMVD